MTTRQPHPHRRPDLRHPQIAAVAGEEFAPPRGRGVRRLSADSKHGRCPACGQSGLLRLDGTLVQHKAAGGVCPGTGQQPREAAPASWLPVRRGLSPHGLRHGHQTWLDDLGVQEMLKSERMGHEIPGMAGVYGHVMPEWRARLRTQLQERWEASLHERARLSPHSAVGLVDKLLAPDRAPDVPSGPTLAPLRARSEPPGGYGSRAQTVKALPEQGFHVG
jgi:hypothetical protein